MFEPVTAARELLAPAMEREADAAANETPDRACLATRLLWEQKRLLAKAVVRGTLASVLVAFLVPSNYESRSELMPPDSQSASMGTLASLTASSGGAGGVLSSAADLLGVRTSGALFIEILRSHTVEDRLINRFDLRRVYRANTYLKARQQLESRTSASEDKKSGVLTIVVSDHDPLRAAAMVQSYVEELNHMVAELNTSAAHRERVFLEERLKVVKQDLDRSAHEFSDFSSKNATIDIKEQARSMVAGAATVQGEIIAAESELRSLEQVYSPNNVRVRSLQARLAELQQQLQKLGGTVLDATTPMPENSYPSLRRLPVIGLTYTDLSRRVTIDESVFEVLTKQYELARVQEAKEIPSVKVIDPAEHPEKRSGPSRVLIILGGATFSLCAAAVWVFSKEAWTNTDNRNPRKVLLKEILESTARWNRTQQISLRTAPGKLRFHRAFHSTNDPS
jgi:uncharacterized protein involved in exopolysaccharide biosynthesis